MKAVHYLIRHPSVAGLIYPVELDEPGYVGFGAFYLLGATGDRIGDAYVFHAVHQQQILETTLTEYRGTRSFFQAQVSGVGSFVFYAQPMRQKPPYVGAMPAAGNLVALRRLRAWQPDALNRACHEHEFYFVGYSPRVDDIGLRAPPSGTNQGDAGL